MEKKSSYFKLARILLILVLAICSVLIITSCSCNDEGDPCESGHSWDAGVLQPTDDCSKGADKLFTCSACKTTKTEKVDGYDHVFVETTIDPTCTKDGSVTRACKNCKITTTDVVKGSHSFETVEVKATCTQPGSVTNTCTVCGFEETTALLASHDYVKEVIEATCTRDGSEIYTCSGCNDSYRTITKRATGHNTEGCQWTATNEQVVGCKYQHIEKTNCKSCNEEVVHTSEFIKHDYHVAITTLATCQTSGIKTKTCNNCGNSVEEPYTDANAHTTGEGVVNGNLTVYSCQNTGCEYKKEVYSAKEEVVATVPSDALQSAGEVELKNASVKLDESVLTQLGGKDVTISADTLSDELLNEMLGKMSEEDKAKLGNGDIFDFSLSQDGNLVATFDGKLTITVPFTLEEGMDPDNIAVWYINDEGKPDSYPATYSNVNGQGYAVFETNHFSYYTVIRMSPEERCALYGHQYETTTVDAVCNEQGYKLDTCKMCKDMKRYDFTAPLTHDYEKTETPATCKEKGYSTFICSLCKDRYISDYVTALPHDLETITVAPTCNAKGYTLVKCKACSFAYTENEVSATGHTYKNGVCQGCGKEASTSGNAYLSLINSLGNAKSFLLKTGGFTVSVSRKGESLIEMVYEFESLQATVTINEDGYFEGKGEVKVIAKQSSGSETMNGDATATVVFSDGNLYVYSTTAADFSSGSQNETMLLCISQDFILDEMFGNGTPELPFDAEKLSAIWDSMLKKENSPLNAALAEIIGLIYIQKETEEGFTYEFNAEFATFIYEELKTKTVGEIFNQIFGENAYDEAVDYIKSALGKTVSELEEDVKTTLADAGISLDEIYAIIEEATGKTVDEALADVRTMHVYEILASIGGKNEDAPAGAPAENEEDKEELTLEDYQGMVDEYAASLKEMNIIEYIFNMVGIDTTENDPVKDVLDSVVESFVNASINFKTNKDGEFISAVTSFNQFVFTYQMGENELSVSMNGSLSFSVNETYMKDYSDVIEEIGSLKGSIAPEKPVYFDEVILISTEDGSFIWSNYNQLNENGLYIQYKTNLLNPEQIGTETYLGQSCIKYKGKITNLYKYDTSYVNASEDCFGWYSVYAELDRGMQELEAYVWMNEDDKIVGFEFVNEVPDNVWSDYARVEYYYAPATNEYSLESSHNYKHIETVAPNGCQYGYYTFQCTICGHSYKDSFGEGHNWVYKTELNEGSSDCTDGATVTRYCAKCNEISRSFKINAHNTYSTEKRLTGTTECGDLIIRYSSCACGEKMYFNYIESDHIFDCRWENNMRIYVCAINDCGYKYTLAEHDEYKYYPEKEETCWHESLDIYTFGDGEFTLRIEDTYPSHDTYPEWNEAQTEQTWTCELCGRLTTTYRYDQYGREIYYYDHIDDYGWEKIFTGCDYVKNYIGNAIGDSDRGTDHRMITEFASSSCSQYTARQSKCSICNYVSETTYVSPDYYWGDGHDTHNWSYFESYDGTFYYMCYRCGTKSALGADGLITLEDMVENGSFKVGYFNRLEFDMDSEVRIELILNYDEDGNGILVENSDGYLDVVNTTPADLYSARESGIVTVDANALKSVIESTDGVETVSLVFWVLDESKTQTDPETGEPKEFWLAHALTFTLDEIYGQSENEGK